MEGLSIGIQYTEEEKKGVKSLVDGTLPPPSGKSRGRRGRELSPIGGDPGVLFWYILGRIWLQKGIASEAKGWG